MPKYKYVLLVILFMIISIIVMRIYFPKLPLWSYLLVLVVPP